MTRQSQVELEAHLVDQLNFLSASARAYDDGHRAEATRLAQVLRVLLHDGLDRKGSIVSPSLLRQVGWLDEMRLLDSAGEPHPASALSACGLVYSQLSGASP